MTAAGSVAVQDRAAQRALAQLQPSDRAVQAVWSGVPGQSDLSLAALDRIARRALRPVLRQAPFAVAVFRQATWGGVFVNLGAVDGLARWIELRGGRLPAPCTPSRCELVQIGGAPAAPRLPFLHVVGRATFRPGAPLSAYFAATGERPPILLANGVMASHTPLPDAIGIARIRLDRSGRAGVDPSWELPASTRESTARRAARRATDLFTVSAPTDAVAATRATGRVAGNAAARTRRRRGLLLGFAARIHAPATRPLRRSSTVDVVWSASLAILLVAATRSRR